MKPVEKTDVLALARNVYLVIALGYVGYGFVGTINKIVDDRIVVSVTEEEFQRFTFPSITFCYPYKEKLGKSVKNVIFPFQDEQGNKLQCIKFISESLLFIEISLQVIVFRPKFIIFSFQTNFRLTK